METIRFVAFSFSALQAGTAVISITEACVTLSTVDHTEPVSITAFLRNTHNAECAITSCFLLLSPRRRLLAACKRPLKDVLIIMLDSGLRNGEVIRMRWETINWEGAFYFNPRGKTRKARRPVPLSERVIALLTTIQLEQSDTRDGWVFPSKKSRAGHIGLSGLEHAFRNVARKLEIPDALKLYCARHTFGTVAMAETKNPGLVKEVMGHESLSTTMGYLHPETAQIKVVIDRLNPLNQQKYVM